MQCNKCNRQIPDNSPFCPRCGAALTQGATVLQQPEEQPAPRPVRERRERPARPQRERAQRPERPRREGPLFNFSFGRREPGTSGVMRNFICFSLATACMVPQFVAEYRRVVQEHPLDATYWLLMAPILLTVFFVFLAIGVPELERKQLEEDRYFEQHGFHRANTGMTETVCNLLWKILLPIGIICFLISGLMWLVATAG